MEGFFEIYGRRELCRILRRHDGGTVDVERVSDGQCFRVSGLAAQEQSAVDAVRNLRRSLGQGKFGD
ncbi:Uncharacterised protein [Burkholderia pseudomallei]|nr:Uncharacterised protein [Burkholderia pseudomallei]CAJ4368690.1 Uncharacterised protein [Burkholderia pseudomallei]